MLGDQSEPRGSTVVETGGTPGHRIVALSACGAQPRLVRVVSASLPMTGLAGRGSRASLQVALRARDGEMPAGQRKGGCPMERGVDGLPTPGVVTFLAIVAQRPCVRVLVASLALARQRPVARQIRRRWRRRESFDLVAFLADDRGMRAGQFVVTGGV